MLQLTTMELSPDAVVDAINALVMPGSAEKSSGGRISTLDGMFELNITKIQELIVVSPKLSKLADLLLSESLVGTDVRWNFVTWNVRLLRVLAQTLNEAGLTAEKFVSKTAAEAPNPDVVAPPLTASVLSVAQQKTVATSLQFVVVLGICPCLQPGVGVPLKRRSELAGALAASDQVTLVDSGEKVHRLTTCVDVILECLHVDTLSSLILSKHLGDLLAVLLQLSHTVRAGNAHSTGSSSPCTMHSNDSKLLTEANDKVTAALMPDSENCRSGYVDELRRLMTRVNSAFLVKELLLLQSGCPPRPGEKAARPPLWLRKHCQSLLCEIVTKPTGVLTVFNSILSGESRDVMDARKCDAAARIVVECCLAEQIDHHYPMLAPQVLEILEGSSNVSFFHAAVAAASHMMSHQPTITSELIIKPLVRPLQICLEQPAVSSAQVICESVFIRCIESIHKVFVLNCEPHSPLYAALLHYLHVLYELFCFTFQSACCLRTMTEEILQRLISSLDAQTAASYLYQLSVGGSTDVLFTRMHQCLSFVAGESGGVKVEAVADTENDFEKWIGAADNIVNLLTMLRRQDKLVAEFFLLCLKELTNIVSSDLIDDNSQTSSRDDRTDCLLDIDRRIQSAETSLKKNLSLLGVIGAMCDRLDTECLSSTEHIVTFTQVTLERSIKILERADDPEFTAFENETLIMAFGLLSALLADQEKMASMNWSSMERLLPLIQQLADVHPDAAIQNMALDLRVAISTHGLVRYDDHTATPSARSAGSDPKSKSRTDHDRITSASVTAENVENKVSYPSKKRQPLIEVLSSQDSQPEPSSMASEEIRGSPSQNEVPRSAFQSAIQELRDPLVPVRGHALISLRRLLEARDAETVGAKDTLLDICREHIADSDSYIYLNAVQLLSTLAAQFPQDTVPWLAAEYLHSVDHTAVQRSAEQTMKLGEVLVKTSAALGPFVPHYRDLLLSTCLQVARHEDSLIRSSAVSNLGQLCQHLHFSLGNAMYEVFECVQSLLKFDRVVEVRRSAAVCATLLLRGLSKDSLKVLGGSLLLEFYRLLKHMLIVERDDVVKLHVQLALEEIDSFMKDFVFPEQTLTKRIHVLDPLDVD